MIRYLLRNNLKFFFFSFFLFMCLASNGQIDAKARRLFENARQLFVSGDNNQAIFEAKKLIKKEPGFVDPYLLLADIYNETDSTILEILFLKSASQLSANPTILYRLGEANYSIGFYTDALLYYEKYLQVNDVLEKRKSKIERKIANCKFAFEAKNHPVDFQPIRLNWNVNSMNDEYWPSLSIDGQKLVFTRLIKSGQFSQEDFFISEFDSAGWGRAIPFFEINTRENEGAQTFSADGKLLFFTACNRAGGKGGCDIYFSIWENGKWSKPKNAGRPLNSNYWEAQPSFSSDNQFLYFSSNRKGGKGKMDIWRVKFQGFDESGDLIWQSPENLGDSINTKGNEISPFIHPNNKSFYFASDFHAGMGGFDLFIAELNQELNFSGPQNFGYPINTFKDEQGLNISSDGKTAYFSSAREPGSGLDIYNFELSENMRPEPVTYVHAKVVDAKTELPVQAKIELINLTNNIDVRSEIADENGEVLLCLPLGANYAFTVSEGGFLFFSESFPLTDLKTLHDPYHFRVELNPVEIGAKMDLYNIYFETDSFSILSESKPELHKLISFLESNSELLVEIQGHTDNSGDIESNQQLSELRAKSVVKYLAENGILSSRLRFIGFGEHNPVSTNKTPEGRMRNRRTTIKILGM
ncbi:MAG: OmpA family protein [Prolixibacteraceae bacterium]|nr:OmpA family protein [Prolixibacteraceae bacterium]MBT6766196.1 OmpA family protein [Prolixibacteraceae bacterium]MBT6999609.1 OmpA family protein [Prolixibacteraceae bacterium]MBT7395450.1 OmpA family protein [Prolixibacteraceae bacterium]